MNTKRGFTLIELVVVLAILALVTHLAVREMAHLRDSRLSQLADRQLGELRDAVWCDQPGQEPTGFVVDTGRLPRGSEMTNGAHAVSVSLRELWERPVNMRPYALRPATAANLMGPATNDLADAEVYIGCGWRGPYIRLPSGAERLMDAWGNRMENLDDAGYDRLLADNGTAVATGGPVWRIRHLGADGRLDSEAEPSNAAQRDTEMRLLPEGGLTNRLSVATTFVDGSGPKAVSGNVQIRWYAPCGDMITGSVAQVEMNGTALATSTFSCVPPGAATLVVVVGGQKRAQERVIVPPGGRDVSMKVFVP